MFSPEETFFSAAGLFVNTCCAAEEETLIFGAALAPVADDASVDDILAVSAARLLVDNLLSVMTALMTFWTFSWFYLSKREPGRYFGMPRYCLVVGFLITKATIICVNAEIAQYIFSAEGKKITTGMVRNGKYLKYFIYFANGELVAIFPILGFIEIFK